MELIKIILMKCLKKIINLKINKNWKIIKIIIKNKLKVLNKSTNKKKITYNKTIILLLMKLIKILMFKTKILIIKYIKIFLPVNTI